MKKFLLTIVIAVLSVAVMPAQNNGRQLTPQQRTEQRIKKLDEKLTLTDKQKTEIRKLYADFNQQHYPVGKRKEAMEKLTSDIMALLTPEQQVIYKQMIEEGLAKRRKGDRDKQKD